MDYDYELARLSPRTFEHLAQALAMAELNCEVQVFGDGPDGGRDAIFRGTVVKLGWSGYGVLQAKFRQRTQGTREDTAWLKRQLRKELHRWETRDTERPEFFILVTNVALSASPGGGLDQVDAIFAKSQDEYAVPLKDWRVWSYDQLRAMLDVHWQVRETYFPRTPAEHPPSVTALERAERRELYIELVAAFEEILNALQRKLSVAQGSAMDAEEVERGCANAWLGLDTLINRAAIIGPRQIWALSCCIRLAMGMQSTEIDELPQGRQGRAAHRAASSSLAGKQDDIRRFEECARRVLADPNYVITDKDYFMRVISLGELPECTDEDCFPYWHSHDAEPTPVVRETMAAAITELERDAKAAGLLAQDANYDDFRRKHGIAT